MNKYITFLLVLLAATGTEAGTLKSALCASENGVKAEELLSPEKMRALGSDIMSVMKRLQIQTGTNDNNPFCNNHHLSAIISCISFVPLFQSCTEQQGEKDIRLCYAENSVTIRGPDHR